MDKRTILAVILSAIVIFAAFLIQNKYAPQQTIDITETETIEEVSSLESAEPVVSDFTAIEDNPIVQDIKVETDIYNISFNTSGAVITSIELKQFDDYTTKEPIEMINRGESLYSAFNISFDGNTSSLLKETFHYKNNGNGVYEFYRDFQKNNYDGTLGETFRIVKKYTFIENENVFKLDVSIINSPYRNYSFSFGPDIGPTYEKLDRNEYRKYYSYYDGKRKNNKINKKTNSITLSSPVQWASITGKYFVVIIIPENPTTAVTWTKDNLEGLENSSELMITNNITSNNITDSFYIYIGPKKNEVLKKYDLAENNAFNLSNNNFEKIIDTSTINIPGIGGLLSGLAFLMKHVLIFFYSIIPNYGIAIILLTILTKIILFPVTLKSLESTSKMQTVQPKLKKIQEQYKNDPSKLNAATAELYKKEGVNPLGGCLPMLLQMPIFLALYGLLNSFFGLRGATFIPGWIVDLSRPELIFTLPFDIPVLGPAVRILPFLYVGTQLIMGKFTQANSAGAGQSNTQMKMLTYGMPIMFFFILYNMPSGLLLYWTVTNLLSTLQQSIINKSKKKKAK